MRLLLTGIIGFLLLSMGHVINSSPDYVELAQLSISDDVVLGRQNAGAARADQRHIAIVSSEGGWFARNISHNKRLLVKENGLTRFARSVTLDDGTVQIGPALLYVSQQGEQLRLETADQTFEYDGYCLQWLNHQAAGKGGVKGKVKGERKAELKCPLSAKALRWLNAQIDMEYWLTGNHLSGRLASKLKLDKLVQGVSLKLGGAVHSYHHLALAGVLPNAAILVKRHGRYRLQTRHSAAAVAVIYQAEGRGVGELVADKAVALTSGMTLTFGYSQFLLGEVKRDSLTLTPLSDKLRFAQNQLPLETLAIRYLFSANNKVSDFSPLQLIEYGRVMLLTFVVVFIVALLFCHYHLKHYNQNRYAIEKLAFRPLLVEIVLFAWLMACGMVLLNSAHIGVNGLIGLFLLGTLLLQQQKLLQLQLPWLWFCLILCGFYNLYLLSEWAVSDKHSGHLASYCRYIGLSLVVVNLLPNAHRYGVKRKQKWQPGIGWLYAGLTGFGLVLILQWMIGDETGVLSFQPIEAGKMLIALFAGHVFASYHDRLKRRQSANLLLIMLGFIFMVIGILFMVHDNSPILLLVIACAGATTIFILLYQQQARWVWIALSAVIIIVGSVLQYGQYWSVLGEQLLVLSAWFLPTERIGAFATPELNLHSAYQVNLAQHWLSQAGWLAALNSEVTVNIPAVQDDFALSHFVYRAGLGGVIAYFFVIFSTLLVVFNVAILLIKSVDSAKFKNYLDSHVSYLIAMCIIFAACLAAGHVIMGLGTNLALTPVIGQPMPFISAGNSFLLCFILPLAVLSIWAESRLTEL